MEGVECLVMHRMSLGRRGGLHHHHHSIATETCRQSRLLATKAWRLEITASAFCSRQERERSSSSSSSLLVRLDPSDK